MIDTPSAEHPTPKRTASTPRSHWRIGVITALALSGAAIGIGAAWVVHQATTKHVSDRTLPGRVHLVVVDVSAGDVHLVNGAGPVRLRSTSRYIFSKPEVATSSADGVLSVRSKCGTWWLHDCSTNIRLSIPAGAAVDADTGHGDITAEGLISRRVRADATGKVRLHLANDPSLIVAHSRRDDVTIRLPSAAYVVDARAAFDQTHIGVPRDHRAPRTIEATASHGQVRIQATPTTERP
jgi:hypothetical protein